MTTAVENNIPNLRFPEFNENWGISPIGNYTELISGIALKSEEITENKNNQIILRGINITEGTIRHSDDIDRYYSGNTKLAERFYVKKGDMVIGMDGSKVGKNVAIVSEDDAGSVLIQRVARVRQKENADICFIYQKVFSSDFHKYVDAVNTSSAIPHISLQQIRDYSIGFPPLPEQQKIASFLTAIDAKIELLTKKKALLEQYKKGVMQQLFSQKFRFKDENGNDFPEWEENKLGDIAPFQRGFDLPIDKIKKGNYPVIFSNGILKFHDQFKVKGPGVVTGRSGTIGKVTYTEKDYWPHNTALWVTDFKRNFPKYVFYFYSHYNLERFATGSGVPTLNRNDIHLQVEYFPSYKEQKKIADFIDNIIKKIELLSSQIKSTNAYKKGLLQQLFI